MDIKIINKLIPALAAFAAREGDYAAAAASPVSPPADVLTDAELLHWFFNVYIPKNEQRFRVYTKAGKTQKFRGPITTDHGLSSDYILIEPKPEDVNKTDFTDDELQILIDGSLRGDLFLSWKALVNDHHRQPSDILEQESELLGKIVPEMWLWSREDVYKEIKDTRTHDGEEPLRDVEWKEIVLWVNKGYKGLNPRVCHWSRSTQRIRQEVRVIKDLSDSVIHRLGEIFQNEREQATTSDFKKLVPDKHKPFVKKGKKQTKESREKGYATKKKNREAEQGGAASASKVVKKKAPKARKARKSKKVDSTEGSEGDTEEM